MKRPVPPKRVRSCQACLDSSPPSHAEPGRDVPCLPCRARTDLDQLGRPGLAASAAPPLPSLPRRSEPNRAPPGHACLAAPERAVPIAPARHAAPSRAAPRRACHARPWTSQAWADQVLSGHAVPRLPCHAASCQHPVVPGSAATRRAVPAFPCLFTPATPGARARVRAASRLSCGGISLFRPFFFQPMFSMPLHRSTNPQVLALVRAPPRFLARV